jgi:hypothetical protein
VDVAGEDEIGARLDEPGQHAVPLGDRLLRERHGAPEQVVVQGDDPVRARRNLPEDLRGALHLLVAQAARLVAPGSDGVEPGDDERIRAVDRLGRLPQPLELRPGPGEPPRERVRDVVVAGDRHQRQLEAPRKEDARSCWLRRPRCVKSPLAITRSGRVSSTSRPSASTDSGLSFLPKCRSERWRTRVGTAA